MFPLRQDKETETPLPQDWHHEFYLRDHLGNTRIVLDELGQAVQENNYYPFGMNIENNDIVPDDPARDTRYLYNDEGMISDEGGIKIQWIFT